VKNILNDNKIIKRLQIYQSALKTQKVKNPKPSKIMIFGMQTYPLATLTRTKYLSISKLRNPPSEMVRVVFAEGVVVETVVKPSGCRRPLSRAKILICLFQV
jgi:hypothetical protein